MNGMGRSANEWHGEVGLMDGMGRRANECYGEEE